jgi:hypothetical protein
LEIKLRSSASWKRIGVVFHLKKNEVVFHLVQSLCLCFEDVLKLFREIASWNWD